MSIYSIFSKLRPNRFSEFFDLTLHKKAYINEFTIAIQEGNYQLAQSLIDVNHEYNAINSTTSDYNWRWKLAKDYIDQNDDAQAFATTNNIDQDLPYESVVFYNMMCGSVGGRYSWNGMLEILNRNTSIATSLTEHNKPMISHASTVDEIQLLVLYGADIHDAVISNAEGSCNSCEEDEDFVLYLVNKGVALDKSTLYILECSDSYSPRVEFREIVKKVLNYKNKFILDVMDSVFGKGSPVDVIQMIASY